jgi:hypothetical protein
VPPVRGLSSADVLLTFVPAAKEHACLETSTRPSAAASSILLAGEGRMRPSRSSSSLKQQALAHVPQSVTVRYFNWQRVLLQR